MAAKWQFVSVSLQMSNAAADSEPKLIESVSPRGERDTLYEEMTKTKKTKKKKRGHGLDKVDSELDFCHVDN